MPDARHRDKHDWYLVKLFFKSCDDFSPKEIISEIIGGILSAFVLVRYGIGNQSELPELIFLAIAGAVFPILVVFLIRFIFVTPYRMIKETEQKLEESELKLKAFLDIKPIRIEVLPIQMLSHENHKYRANILVCNYNQGVTHAKLTLKKVDPPLHGLDCLSDACDLDFIKFPLDGSIASIISGKGDTRVHIFDAELTPAGMVLSFCGEWANIQPNQFSVQIKAGKPMEHILTFATSATGVNEFITQLRMTVFQNGSNLPFILERVDKELIIYSAEYGTESKNIDVTQAVRDAIFENKINLIVGNGLTRVDPAPYDLKTVKIIFSFDGIKQIKYAAEKEQLRLP